LNVIHRFPDSLYWQFIGATTSRNQESQWSINYRWIHDPGQAAAIINPIIMPDGTDVPITTPAPSLEAGALMIPVVARAPFAKWRVIPSADIGDRPSITTVRADAFRTIDPLGYQTLPGNPIP
jgi:hypothetical protein